jgi:DNA mismatch repair protein MutS
MNFTIDRQSLDELNLMGKFRSGSVYFLFNRLKTRGGELLLDQLFSTPLTDEEAINKRVAVFRSFQQARLEFPFDPGQVGLMREYTDVAGSKGRLATYLQVLVKKALSGLARDEQYKVMIQGLQATIVTLKKCQAFAAMLAQMGGAYAERANVIKDLLEAPALSQLIETDIYKAISAKTIAAYDHLLKTKLNSSVKQVLHFIAEADVNIAVSSVAEEKGFTYAKALPRQANALSAVDLKHPCIEKAVGNDIQMRVDHNVVFLTGANMAGKSTWMKTIGISLYLAHIGFPVAARSMEFSIREGIYSSINVADNIALGYSHFYAEVVRVKNAAQATGTGKYLLLMFDELFKGTNVKDAYDGTLAVTAAFAEYKNCLFIVSTHIIEVGEALRSKKNIQFTYMPTVMEGSIPRYTYQLQQGITEDRQGMLIIRNEGILDLIGS